MIRKILLPIALLIALALLAYCGDGAGKSSEPVGVGAGQPSIIQLQAVQHTAQTNSTINLKAKVLDGNGRAVPNVPVTFTNLSSLGELSSNQAVTDTLGFATVSIFSAVTGFATVQAEVNSGAGKVRDKKTVFFVTALAKGFFLTLAVDNNNDNSFNDLSDFIFFDPAAPHDQAIVMATVLNGSGLAVVNDTVTFSADTPEATFPDGFEKQTNSDGQAFVRIKIVPSELRNITVPVNVTGVSTTGAFNVITLYIGPITIGQVSVTANPQSVASGGTSTITAVVTTAAGTVVPDGTTVNFTTSNGTITPFAQTTQGVATATLTAPTISGGSQTATITASVAGKSGTTSVSIIGPTPTPTPTPSPTPTPTPVAVNPTSTILHCGTAGNSTLFVVTGGTPSKYSVVPSTNGSLVTISKTTLTTNGQFTVTANSPCTSPAGDTIANLVVTDTATSFLVPVTITNP